MLRLLCLARGGVGGAFCSNSLRPLALLRRNMFIQTQETPNVNSLKFLPGIYFFRIATDHPIIAGQSILENGKTLNFENDSSAKRSPLAVELFRIYGVNGVMLGDEFITVSKDNGIQWSMIKPEVFATIMDFFSSGKPVIDESADEVHLDTKINEDDSETVQMIKEILDSRIRFFSLVGFASLIFLQTLCARRWR